MSFLTWTVPTFWFPKQRWISAIFQNFYQLFTELGRLRGYSPPPSFSLYFLLGAELPQHPHFKSLISLFHNATSKSRRFSTFPILRLRLPFWLLYWSRVGAKDIFWCFFARLNLRKIILIVEVEPFVKLLLFLCHVVKMDTKRQLKEKHGDVV